MTKLKFSVPGNPLALARPRFGRHHVFDSQQLEKLSSGLSIRNQMGNKPMFTNCPLFIDIIFYMKIPKGSLKKRAEYIDKFHICRPDTDNCIKFLLDTCNNIVYQDDSLIAKITATKIYGDDPRTDFTIGTL